MRLLALFVLAFCALASPASAQKRIAFSFDDVPRRPGGFMTVEERTTRLLAQLRRARIRQAAFFVNPGHLEEPFGAGGAGRISRYVRAGHVIANHSYSHESLSAIGARAYLADIDRASAWLVHRRGYRPWFRYPYLDEGTRRNVPDLAVRDAVRAGLATRGLANGYVTVDSYDWYLDSIAGNARTAGRQVDMNALRDLFVRIVVGTAEWQDRIARETLHRQPVHVMLMHEADVTTLFLADAVRALRRRGWRIATMDEAYRDPIARVTPETRHLGGGRVTAIAAAAGRAPRDLAPPLNEEATILRLFNEQVLRQPPRPEPGDRPMIAALLAAMLIPPPPDWQPPHFTGPGLLCANRYGLALVAGESATLDWPGEIFINDLFSTFRVTTPRGGVVVTENGPTTRPSGTGRRAGRAGSRFIRDHGGGVYSVEVATTGPIRAVTLRFAPSFATADRRALLSRLRIDAPRNPQCLQPDNRPETSR